MSRGAAKIQELKLGATSVFLGRHSTAPVFFRDEAMNLDYMLLSLAGIQQWG